MTGSTFSRDELVAAFEKFEATVDRAAQTRDWDPWVEQYTPDVTLRRARRGHDARPRRGAPLDLADDGELPRQLHDVVPVAVVGVRRVDRSGHLRARQSDARPRRRHDHHRHQHLDHHLRGRWAVAPSGGHLQPAAVREGGGEVVPQGRGTGHAARRGGRVDASSSAGRSDLTGHRRQRISRHRTSPANSSARAKMCASWCATAPTRSGSTISTSRDSSATSGTTRPCVRRWPASTTCTTASSTPAAGCVTPRRCSTPTSTAPAMCSRSRKMLGCIGSSSPAATSPSAASAGGSPPRTTSSSTRRNVADLSLRA